MHYSESTVQHNSSAYGLSIQRVVTYCPFAWVMDHHFWMPSPSEMFAGRADPRAKSDGLKLPGPILLCHWMFFITSHHVTPGINGWLPLSLWVMDGWASVYSDSAALSIHIRVVWLHLCLFCTEAFAAAEISRKSTCGLIDEFYSLMGLRSEPSCRRTSSLFFSQHRLGLGACSRWCIGNLFHSDPWITRLC